MSKEYNSALQARVEQFLKEKNISQAKAAPLMGISQTALSQYRRSMYDNGDIAALESKLEEFFRTQEEQEVNTEKALPYRPTQDYIPTSISEDVYTLLPAGEGHGHHPRGCGNRQDQGGRAVCAGKPHGQRLHPGDAQHRHPGEPAEGAGAGAEGAGDPEQVGFDAGHPGEAGGHKQGHHHR